MFRGPEILDTRVKLEKWMATLCEEVAERLVKDQEQNDRVAKSLHITISQENVGHASRCGPLFSYDPIKMTRQALLLIAKSNTLPSDDLNWRPKLRMVAVSASKFVNAASSEKSIQSFFKSNPESNQTSSESNQMTSESNQMTSAEIDSAETEIETLESNEIIAAESNLETFEVEKEPCEKCGQEVSPFEMPEHLDFHLAKDLQAELRREERQQRPLQTASKNDRTQATSAAAGKRKNQTASKSTNGIKGTSDNDAKKQKTISSFFTKK